MPDITVTFRSHDEYMAFVEAAKQPEGITAPPGLSLANMTGQTITFTVAPDQNDPEGGLVLTIGPRPDPRVALDDDVQQLGPGVLLKLL